MKKYNVIALALLALSLLITLDLWNNYCYNLIPQDGISALHSVMHRLLGIFGDSRWSLERFYHAFAASAFISVGLGVINLELLYLSRKGRSAKLRCN